MGAWTEEAMPRGPERPWRAQRGPHLDGHILAAAAHGELVENEIEPGQAMDAETATALKQALYRAARRQGYSLSATVEKSSTGYQVRFKVFNKAEARAYMIAKYGADRSKWPYNPRARQVREDGQ